MPAKLLSDAQLHDSPVVANSMMNRQRGATGVNSYARELRVDPLEFLSNRQAPIAWLDLCCGEGRAILEGARHFGARQQHGKSKFRGVDLVDAFVRSSVDNAAQFLVAGLPGHQESSQYDLITCVHGVHYIGDKLRLIADAARWLKPDGLLLASFDPQSIFDQQQRSLQRDVLRLLRKSGFEYTPRHHLLSRNGRVEFESPWSYLGASDAAGPNYTGQPAVNSHYQLAAL